MIEMSSKEYIALIKLIKTIEEIDNSPTYCDDELIVEMYEQPGYFCKKPQKVQ